MKWYSNLSIQYKIFLFNLLILLVVFGMILIFDPIIASLESQYTAETQSQLNNSFDFVFRGLQLFGLIVLVISIFATITIRKYVIKPTRDLLENINEITLGNIRTDISLAPWNDEIGKLNNGFLKMLLRLQEITEFAESVAGGELKRKLKIDSEKDILSISINKMVDSFRQISSEVTREINQLGSTAAELNSVIAQFSSSVAETASSISETTSTVEEVTKTSEISNNKSKEAVGMMNEVSSIAEEGKNSVEDSLRGFQIIKDQISAIGQNIIQLTEFNQSIGEIINSVNDISEQSNLLAVNASIEAARAGEYGKTFVIVAQEIKNLADKSKLATSKVRSLLSDIQNSINTAVLATEKGEKSAAEQTGTVNKAGAVIHELSQTLENVKDVVLQSSLTMQEQFAGMDQIAMAMENIKTAGEQNAVGAKQLQETSVTIKDVGLKLKDVISKLTL